MIWALVYFGIGLVLTAIQFFRLIGTNKIKDFADFLDVLFGFVVGITAWPVIVIIIFFDTEDM